MGSSDFDDDEEDWGSDDSIDAELDGDDGSSLDSDGTDVDLASDDFSEADLVSENGWTGIDEDGYTSEDSLQNPSSSLDVDAIESKHADKLRKKAIRSAEEERLADKGLPVKLADGQIARNARSKPVERRNEAKNRVRHAVDQAEEVSESESEGQRKRKERAAKPKVNPYGARFGRPAVTSVLEIEDRTQRLVAAREELATLGREIIAEPELGMNLLKRLLSFTEEVFCPPGVKKEDGLPVDLPIRSLALLSALAVFLDITP